MYRLNTRAGVLPRSASSHFSPYIFRSKKSTHPQSNRAVKWISCPPGTDGRGWHWSGGGCWWGGCGEQKSGVLRSRWGWLAGTPHCSRPWSPCACWRGGRRGLWCRLAPRKWNPGKDAFEEGEDHLWQRLTGYWSTIIILIHEIERGTLAPLHWEKWDLYCTSNQIKSHRYLDNCGWLGFIYWKSESFVGRSW